MTLPLAFAAGALSLILALIAIGIIASGGWMLLYVTAASGGRARSDMTTACIFITVGAAILVALGLFFGYML